MDSLNLKNVGRNDPCPCGSGKKFKKCHGESTLWQGSAAKEDSAETASAGAQEATMPGFDPSKMDLNWLAQFSTAMQRLPKGQLIRLQGLMQKAMSGKDVAREMEEFQKTLPASFQEMLKNSPQLEEEMNSSMKTGTQTPSTPLTDEQKAQLQQIQKNNEKTGFAKLWNRFKKS